jgi:hypothetical protein
LRQDHPALRLALISTEKILARKNLVVSDNARGIFNRAGAELAQEAIAQPLAYLKSLSLLKSLADGQVKPVQLHAALLQIRKALWKVLPDQSPSPQGLQTTTHKLDSEFLEKLEQIKYE